MFYFEEINGKKILKSSVLSNLNHFFTTRETVILSQEEELEELVQINKEDIANYLNIDKTFLISPTQTHTSNVRLASKKIKSYPNTDALIDDDPTIAIYLNFADCTPIILYDKRHNIGAVVHAG